MKANFTFAPTTFTCPPSSGGGLVYKRVGARTICRAPHAQVIFMQFILLVTSWGTGAMIWSGYNDETHRIPQPFWTIAAGLCLVCALIFMRNLFGTPRVECRSDRQEIWFFKRTSRLPTTVIRRDEIDHLGIEEAGYQLKQRTIQNYILCVTRADKSVVRLFASTKRPLIEEIGQIFAGALQRPMTPQ